MNEKNHLFSNHALKMLLIPLVAEQFLTSLMGTADSMMVSNVGSAAISAVSLVDSINVLVIQAFAALSAGGTIVCSQYIGQKNLKKATESARQLLLAVASISVLVMVVCLAFRTPLLRLVFGKVDAEVMDASKIYFLITSLSFPFIALYDAGASVYRAQGDSATPLRISVVANCLNITGNAVLIWVFHMGVAGAAYATVISQGVSGFLCLIFIIKKVPVLHMEKGEFRLEKNLSIQQLKVGFPMALQYSITAIGTMMVQSALNMLGSIAVAAFTAANKIENLLTQAFVAQGVTMATYCAQNMGAGRPDRIRKGFRAADMQGFLYGIGAGIFFIFAGKYLTYLFLSENVEEVIGNVEIYLRCIGIFMIPLAIVNIYRNGIQGMGYGLLPMMAGVAELVGRGATALVAAHYRSYFGTCMASPVAWILASALLLVMYHFIMKDLDQRFKSNVESAKNRL